MKRYLSSVATSGVLLLAACGDHATQPRLSTPTSAALGDNELASGRHTIGGVYVSTNATTGNAVVAFARLENGALLKIGEFQTGGLGIGGGVDPLLSQGSVILSSSHKRLFVVNAGSNSISTFAVGDDASLSLLGTVGSGGFRPISLTLGKNRLFVLNGDNSITGFAVDGDALSRPISHVSLGSASDGPSTISSTRDGKFLFVTQRAVGAIDVVAVGGAGELIAVSRRPSSGGGPFGFAVTSRDQLIVSEASGAAPSGAVSSYQLTGDAALSTISASLSTNQAATCWLVLTNDERFAFAANAGGGSIAGYAVSPDGSLLPLNADGRTGVTNSPDATPLDMDITTDGKFLYVLQTGTGTVGAFAISSNGRLTVLPDTPGLAASAGYQGIATF